MKKSQPRPLVTLTSFTKHGAIGVANLYVKWGAELVEPPRPGSKFPWEVVVRMPEGW